MPRSERASTLDFMQDSDHIPYMQRCFELARAASGFVAPNPMVGAVVVHNGLIVGEGYHERYGEAHAEVNAIAAVKDESVLKDATIYVNLEPCAHFGKTPPCADLIVQKGIPRVVIGCRDPFPEVDGKGIERLKAAGVDVTVGVLEAEAKAINKRFLSFHQNKRPYVILKWAQTSDGFIDQLRQVADGQTSLKITSEPANRLVHRWRSEEAAIIVGSQTALFDNPKLNVRKWTGPNPIRVVLDRSNALPPELHLFDQSQPTFYFSAYPGANQENLRQFELPQDADINQVLDTLYNEGVQSVLVEGGASIHRAFLAANSWDETRVFVSEQVLTYGVAAPSFPNANPRVEQLGRDRLFVFHNA